MAGVKRVLQAEVIPAWRTFLKGVTQIHGQRKRLKRGFARSGPAWKAADQDGRERLLGGQSHRVSRMLEESPSYPQAKTVWRVADVLRQDLGHAWCAGPLVVFAAGHFHAFLATFVLADIPAGRKRELLGALSDTIATAVIAPPAYFKGTKQKIRACDKMGNQSMTVYDRQRTWILTPEEEAACGRAWEQYTVGTALLDHPDLLAAGIAARAGTEPLAARQTVILAALGRWLASQA